ncbi:MAG TPA: carboxypeptidase regulatory-like domain-containing protein, partial [Blastocatellia bacterium]|nr:carboxypeptidase regulatory-like domain-containing protein [Blastocatellia bacterium]
MRHRIWAALAASLLLTTPAWGQFNSALQGVAQDATRAVVPNAVIKLTNVQTGISQETRTNESGYYRFSSLAPGDYELRAEATGFQTKVLKFALTTGQTRDVNFDLEVKAATELVQVTAEAPLLDTAETRQQLTLKQEKIRDLPLFNNSIFSILALAPGVVGTNAATDNFRPEYFSGISANGRSAYGNTFNVDGLSVTSNITNGTLNFGVNPEAVQEVTIETNTFKAEQGLGSSIVVSVTTKSGTNQFHGAGNYWFTNQDMRARTSLPFVARYAPFARQNVNAAFGGPIIKNKTFFFGSVEMLRSKNAATSVETYEAPDFVNWARQNFPNTIGTQVLSDYPADGPVQTNVLRRARDILGTGCGTPATSNIPCDLPLVVQGTWNRSPFFNGLQYSFRGDQYLRGGRDRIYGSYAHTESDNLNANLRSKFNNISDRFVHAYQASWTHTFSSTLLNEARFGLNYNKTQSLPAWLSPDAAQRD